MYKETVASNKKTLFIIIGVIVLSMISFAIVDAAPVQYRALLQLGLLALLAILIYFLIRLHTTDYSYLVINDELIFNKKASRADLSLLTVKIANIVNIMPLNLYQEEKPPIPRNRTYNIKKNLGKKGVFVCTFIEKGEHSRVLFEPTDKLLTIIAKRRDIIRMQQEAAATQEK